MLRVGKSKQTAFGQRADSATTSEEWLFCAVVECLIHNMCERGECLVCTGRVPEMFQPDSERATKLSSAADVAYFNLIHAMALRGLTISDDLLEFLYSERNIQHHIEVHWQSICASKGVKSDGKPKWNASFYKCRLHQAKQQGRICAYLDETYSGWRELLAQANSTAPRPSDASSLAPVSSFACPSPTTSTSAPFSTKPTLSVAAHPASSSARTLPIEDSLRELSAKCESLQLALPAAQQPESTLSVTPSSDSSLTVTPNDAAPAEPAAFRDSEGAEGASYERSRKRRIAGSSVDAAQALRSSICKSPANTIFNQIDELLAVIRRCPLIKPKTSLQLFGQFSQGGHAEVLFGTYEDCEVAVKYFPRPNATVPLAARLFRLRMIWNEISVSSSLDKKTERVVRVIAVCMEGESLFVVQPLFPRGDLATLVRVIVPGSGIPLPLHIKHHIMIDVAQAALILEVALYLNRDMKLENILVPLKGRPMTLCDFGISKALEGQRDFTIATLGTPGYMPTEAILRQPLPKGTESKIDVFSFAMCMFELLTGVNPWLIMDEDRFVIGSERVTMLLQHQYRPEFLPEYNVHKFYQDLLKECWAEDPSERPTFKKIVDGLLNPPEDVRALLQCGEQQHCSGSTWNTSELDPTSGTTSTSVSTPSTPPLPSTIRYPCMPPRALQNSRTRLPPQHGRFRHRATVSSASTTTITVLARG